MAVTIRQFVTACGMSHDLASAVRTQAADALTTGVALCCGGLLQPLQEHPPHLATVQTPSETPAAPQPSLHDNTMPPEHASLAMVSLVPMY
jgi:hypothetical protein